jgi:membrane dipeptidase
MGQPVLVDAHSDLLIDVTKKRTLGAKSVIERDWVPGMRQAGVGVRLAAVYVDQGFLPHMALKNALAAVAALHSEVDESPSVQLCTSYTDIRQAIQDDRIALLLSMEGAEPLLDDANLLDIFYKLGLRALGLTHSRRNHAADGSRFFQMKAGTPGGLSDFGVELVERAQVLGVLVDVSHINDAGFWDIIDMAQRPVIASHSNCRALCNHPRNLTDEQIKAVAETGGVVGALHFCFDPQKKTRTVTHLLDHLDHVVQLVGTEHAGLGFDFADYALAYLSEYERARLPMPGFETSPEDKLTEDGDVPLVIAGMERRGYTSQEIERIAGGNLLRVFQQMWG